MQQTYGPNWACGPNLSAQVMQDGVKMTLMSLFERITRAHRAIRPQVLVTPLDRSRSLSNALG